MKRHRLNYSISFLMLLSLTANAQKVDSLLADKYDRQVIFIHHTNNKYCKNNKFIRVGIFGKQLGKEFVNVSSLSKEEFELYRKRKKKGLALLTAGGITFLALPLLAPAIVPALAFHTVFVISATSAGTYAGGCIYLHESKKNLTKAVWLRNKDVLVKK